MKRKQVIIPVVVFAAAAVGALVWWALQPHSGRSQLEHAEASREKLQARLPQLSPEERIAEYDRLIKKYQAVWEKFDDDGSADDAKQRIAEICSDMLNDKAEAARWYERLLADHPESDLAEEATHRLARIWQDLALAEKEPDKALDLYRKAVDLLDKFVTDHPDSPRAEADVIEIARIWQDHIQDPPIRTKEALERYLNKWSDGKFADEAMFRLGQWYESVKMPEDAAAQYSQLVKKFGEKSKYYDRAQERLVEIYAKKLDDKEKAAEAAREIARRNPSSSKGARYAKMAETFDKRKVEDKDRKYEGEYYGSPVYDTAYNRPLLPWELYKDLIAQKLDTIRYTMDVYADPSTGQLRMKGKMELKNGGDEKQQIVLQLSGDLMMDSAEFDGARAEVASASSPGREIITLKLARPWPAGASAVLAFEASGKYEAPTVLPEGLDLESGKLPTPEEQQKIMEALKGNMWVRVGPRDGFALASTAWYPLTYYGDVFTADVTYHVAGKDFEISSMGARTSPAASGSEVVRRYVEDTPVFALCFAYGQWKPIEADWSDGRKIVAYVAADREKLGRALVDSTRRILDFYESKFGKLNQPTVSVSLNPLPAIIGGMGPAGMMLLSDHYVRGDQAPVSLLAHELAHQWWGNEVPVSFESGYSMWLSEGFATYSDALYNEYTHGEDFMRRHLQKYSLIVYEGLIGGRGYGDPVADSIPGRPLYRQIVYEKGALVLHTLRYLLGDEKFFETLRRYARDYRGKHSTIEDFRRLAEEISGQDLRWFFNEWLRRGDIPHYTITGLTDDGQGAWTITVKQTVPGTESPWRTPIDVGFYGPDGKSYIEHKAKMDEEENTLTVRLNWKPDSVLLDPDEWVFHHPGPDNRWPRPAQPEGASTDESAAPAAPAGGGDAPATDEGGTV